MTAKESILEVVVPETSCVGWMTAWELKAILAHRGIFYGEHSLATRCNDLEHEGLLAGRDRKDTTFREYARVVGPARPRMSTRTRKPRLGRVIGIQGTLVSDFEDILVRVPKGRYQVGQEI